MGHLKAAACAILFATIGASAIDRDPAIAEAGIAAAYDAQCSALVRGDAAAWTATLAPGFVPTMTDGTQGTAKSAHDGVAALLASTRITNCRIVPEEIDLVVGDAVVAAGIAMSGTQTGGHALAVEQHAVDRWTLVGGGWLQKSSRVLEQTVIIDGRIVQHATAKGMP